MRPVQPLLGIIAPSRHPLTPSQRTMIARAGTQLSLAERIRERQRLRREEREHNDRKLADSALSSFAVNREAGDLTRTGSIPDGASVADGSALSTTPSLNLRGLVKRMPK